MLLVQRTFAARRATNKDVRAGYIEANYVSPWVACRGLIDAHIAQSVEHFLGKEEVTGSIPVMGSMHDVVTR
jgi:hypothetical protein